MPFSHMSSKPFKSKQTKKLVRKQINFIFFHEGHISVTLLHCEY